jgi:acetyl esterase/lipase
MRYILFFFLVFFWQFALAQKTTVQYKEIDGVDPDLLSLDIYSPEVIAEKLPVIFWVHGGAWAIGNKKYTPAAKARFFVEHGYVFVTVNYRLSPFPLDTGEPDRIKHPDHIEDVASAARWVYDHIEKYGGDRNRMVAMGHSAGAHLVALLATNQKYLNNEQLPVTVFSGVVPIDTEGFDVEETINSGGPVLKKFYRNAFGNDVKLWEDASPIKQIEKGEALPPYWLLFERGSDSRVQQMKVFAGTLRKNQVKVKIVDATGLTHMAVNKRIGKSFDQIVSPAITKFLETVFNLP